MFRLLWWPNDSHVQPFIEAQHRLLTTLKDFISCQTKPDKSAAVCPGSNRNIVLRFMKRRWNTDMSKSCRNTLAASGSTERPSNSQLIERLSKLASFTQTSTFLLCFLSDTDRCIGEQRGLVPCPRVFGMQTGADGGRTANLPVSRWPALPGGTQGGCAEQITSRSALSGFPAAYYRILWPLEGPSKGLLPELCRVCSLRSNLEHQPIRGLTRSEGLTVSSMCHS